MELLGTMFIELERDISSADGKRRFYAGETVFMAVEAGALCRVWQEDGIVVGAQFYELVGSRIIEDDEMGMRP